MQDGQPVVEKILLGVEKMTRTDNKISLCKVRFNLGACKSLSEEEVNSLSDTARNFFRFVQAFQIKLKLRNFVNIWNSNENSKIQEDTMLTKRTIETLLNELFSLDDPNNNEQKMEQYATKIGLQFTNIFM